MAGTRGLAGPPGPPDGTFSVNVNNELVFTETGGTPIANLGAIAPLFIGDYDALVAYTFLQVVKSGSLIYIHFGTAATTGTAVTDTTVWQPVVGGLAAVATSGAYGDLSGAPTFTGVTAFVVLTQTAYNALTPNATTLYIIVN